MEATRPRPPGVLDAAATPDFAAVFDDPGPFVSVYLTTEPAVENASQLTQARWKAVRDELAADGAPEELLSAIDPLVPDAHTHGRALVAVAGAGGARFHRYELEPTTRDFGRFTPLPSLGPALEWEQAAIPHVVVLANRAGADLVAVTRHGDVVTSAGDDDGHDPELRRSAPGGWSQRRYQQRAENLWDERAKEVADAVAGLVDDVDARLVTVAGDVRAVQLLEVELPARVADLVREIPGSRAADGGLDEVAEETVRLAATVAAEDTVVCLQRLKEGIGQGPDGLAVQDVEPTFEALREARVDVLLVHDDPSDERTAWFGPDANLVASQPEPLQDLGVADPSSARLVDVAVRAALGTGAAVRVVPDVVPGGLAALLRH